MQVALAPLSAHQLFTAISVLQDSPVLELTELLSQIRQGQKELNASEQKSARGQLLQYVPCYVVQHWGKSEVVSTTGAAAGRYWLAMIAAQSAAAKEKMAATRQTAGGSRPGAGRPAKKETFPGIAPCLEEFAAGHDYQADRRRRSHETRAEGFRLVDALHHLYEKFPELYEAGMSKDTVARIFTAPRKKTVAGGKYYAAVNARVAPTTNNARLENEATHFARTQQKLLREWHAFHGQPCASGDDMNIIQVGRPAVSRYHRNRKYFRGGKGIDNDVHDFPNARYGLKLGGFMLLAPVSNVEPSSDSQADSSSCSGLQAEAAEAGPREQAPIHMTDE